MRKLRQGMMPTVVWGLVSILLVFVARAGWNAIYANWEEQNGQTFSATPGSANTDIRTTATLSRNDATKPEADPYTTLAQFTLLGAGSGKSVGDWVPVPEGVKHINWGTDDPNPNEVDTVIELKLRDGRVIGPVPVSQTVKGIRASDITALRASNKRPEKAVTVIFRAAR